MKRSVEAGPRQPEPKPVHKAPVLFANRARTVDDSGLIPIVIEELGSIPTASRKLIVETYLDQETYVEGLVGDMGSPDDHRDATLVGDHIRRAVIVRAGELGIITD